MIKAIAVILLMIVAGCSSIDQMHSNMQQTNELLKENSRIMTASQETIGTNTEEVRKSTETMMQFQKTIKENSSLIQQILGQLSEHPLFFPIGFLLILLLLLVPSMILYFAFRSLTQQMKEFVSRRK